jgi:predicted Zn-dependent peptidase
VSAADRSRLPEVGPDPAFTFPRIVRHRLANGLDVRTIEHHNAPVVTFVILVQGGAGADVPGREGLAALTADMVDEGTGSLSALDVSDAWARIGGEYDVDTGPDALTFSLTTLTRFASRGAGLLADILIRPSMREADFERVRQMRVDRVRQLKDLPHVVAERAFLRLLYADHPYGHLSIGTGDSLRAMTLDDTSGFHAAAFQPARATLVVAGAIGHDEMRAVAEAAFGGWAAREPAAAVQVASEREPQAAPPRLAVIPREGAAQSELRIGHLSARRSTPDYAALLVMNAVLGGQFVSRINLKLREEKGFTYGARTGFDWRRGPGPFALHASVQTAATAEAIADALDELAAIRASRPATAEELTLAKASLTRGYPRNFETAQQVARSVAQLALYDLPDTYFEQFVPRVNAIESADVTRVAQRHLDPGRMTTLIVGDHAAIAGTLDTLGLGQPRLLPAEGGNFS